jgi:hypothetical protein
MYHIVIIKQEIGYIVSVDCQKFYFTTIDGMILELASYLRNPHAIEQEYQKSCMPLSEVARERCDPNPIPVTEPNYPLWPHVDRRDLQQPLVTTSGGTGPQAQANAPDGLG